MPITWQCRPVYSPKWQDVKAPRKPTEYRCAVIARNRFDNAMAKEMFLWPNLILRTICAIAAMSFPSVTIDQPCGDNAITLTK